METNNNFKKIHPYQYVSGFYDKMMEHVDYNKWAIYIYNLLYQYDLSFGKILEAGCGTGIFSQNFPLPLIGMDLNLPMLQVYRKRSEANLICAQLPDFSGIKRDWASGILCLYDTINYLLSDEEWHFFFHNSHQLLNRNGWLIFDIVTPYCCMKYFNNEVFQEDIPGGNFIRKTKFDKKSKTQHNFFYITTEEGTFFEHHLQYVPSISWIRKTIKKFNFEILAVYDDLTINPINRESLRAHFIIKKVI